MKRVAPLMGLFLLLWTCLCSAQPVQFPDENLKGYVEWTLGISDPTPTNMLMLLRLDQSSSGITDLRGLEYARNLGLLRLSFGAISDLSPLAGLTNLHVLSLGHHQISDISPLSGLRNIENLNLEYNDIRDITPLSELTKLRYLNQSCNQIADVSALSGLENLQTLNLEQNNIGDITPLSGLVNIYGLDLSSNEISDIPLLSGLVNLQELDLFDNEISDISQLVKIPNLFWLDIRGNPLDDRAYNTYIPQLILKSSVVYVDPVSIYFKSTKGGRVSEPDEGFIEYDWRFYLLYDCEHGIRVPIEATANNGHHFVKWSGDAADVGKVVNPYSPSTTVTVDGIHYHLVANFAPGTTELIGMEVTQAIQDWTNSVPLIENKTTYVRAHIQSNEPEPVRVVAKLRGFRDGDELPESPLRALNQGGAIYARPDAGARRDTWNDSLNFRLPQEWLTGKVELQLEPVGCSIAFGRYANAHNGSELGTVEVEFEPMPELPVKLIRLWWRDDAGNEVMPSETAVTWLALRLRSIYPISRVNYSMASHRWWGEVPPRLDGIIHDLKLMLSDDDCLCYGIVPGSPGDSTVGIANAIPGVAACGYLPDGAFDYGRHRMAHELAHCLGMQHAVNHELTPDSLDGIAKLGPCGSEANADAPDFPYIYVIGDSNKPTIGPMDLGDEDLIYGLDTHTMTVVDPTEHFELMSYCKPWRWISDVTYAGLKDAIATRFGGVNPTNSKILDAPTVNRLIVRGLVDLTTDTVELRPFGLLLSPDSLPAPSPGDYVLELRDGGGNLLSTIPFQPDEHVADSPEQSTHDGSFLIAIPADPEIENIAVYHNAALLASRTASRTLPSVQVLLPNGGEVLDSEQITIQWSGADADGDELTYFVQYSSDGGMAWETLAFDCPATACTVRHEVLKGTDNGLIRIIASDGFKTAVDCSDTTFSVGNNPPDTFVLAPKADGTFTGDEVLILEATSLDMEDGQLLGTQLQWSSDIDGPLGTGDVVLLNTNSLSEGRHIISVSAADSNGSNDTASVNIDILHHSYDLNHDGHVNFMDFTILGKQWRAAPSVPSADIAPPNRDNTIDYLDLVIFAEHWLESTIP